MYVCGMLGEVGLSTLLCETQEGEVTGPRARTAEEAVGSLDV